MYKHNFFTLKITEYSIFILYNIYIKYLQTNLYDYGYVVKKNTHTHFILSVQEDTLPKYKTLKSFFSMFFFIKKSTFFNTLISC